MKTGLYGNNMKLIEEIKPESGLRFYARQAKKGLPLVEKLEKKLSGITTRS
jgi:hypothetical protein